MEEKRSNRKRKRSPSNPFTGIFTRRKSQMYLHHHNRSGKSRLDPVRKIISFPPPPLSLTNPKNQTNGDLDDEVYHISIKDLRARRVFSKPLVLNPNKNVNPNIDSELIACKLDEFDGFGTLENSESGVDFECQDLGGENPNPFMSKKCDSGVDFKGDDLNDGNPNSSRAFIEGRISDDMSPNLSGKDLEGKNGEKMEENEQSTPPDADILVRQINDQNSLQTTNAALTPSNEISPSKDKFAAGKKISSNSKRDLVLKPCSRLKIYKAPNSFSYRRLLPYLMDLAKDTSCALGVNPLVKTDNGVEEKPLVTPSQESFIDCCKLDENLVMADGIEEKMLYLDPKASDSSAQQASIQTSSCCILDESLANFESNETQIGNPIPNDEQVSSDNIGKLDDVSPIVESDLAPLSHSCPKESPEGECREAHVEFNTEESSISLSNNSSKLEAICPSSIPDFSLAKGILKRNPRGCRGVCNCLNCASFRLNAEKSFEFSRNQLHESEELAFDLMKELSDLRTMLEKSVNGDNNYAILPVNRVQEACRRISEVEAIARNRLTLMSQDLYVHCRTKPLQRPRVNFSNCVEEKVIK